MSSTLAYFGCQTRLGNYVSRITGAVRIATVAGSRPYLVFPFAVLVASFATCDRRVEVSTPFTLLSRATMEFFSMTANSFSAILGIGLRPFSQWAMHGWVTPIRSAMPLRDSPSFFRSRLNVVACMATV